MLEVGGNLFPGFCYWLSYLGCGGATCGTAQLCFGFSVSTCLCLHTPWCSGFAQPCNPKLHFGTALDLTGSSSFTLLRLFFETWSHSFWPGSSFWWVFHLLALFTPPNHLVASQSVALSCCHPVVFPFPLWLQPQGPFYLVGGYYCMWVCRAELSLH